MEKEITNNEIFDALVRFARDTDARFNAVDARFDAIDVRFNGVDGRCDGIETRLRRIESLMVTKDYLDDKLADVEGRMVQMVDRKIALAC